MKNPSIPSNDLDTTPRHSSKLSRLAIMAVLSAFMVQGCDSWREVQLRGSRVKKTNRIKKTDKVDEIEQVGEKVTKPSDLIGDWACSIKRDAYQYPSMKCSISRKKNKKLYLEKHRGSQRFKGYIELKSDNTFTFSGTYFCPVGDCTHKVDGDFNKQSDTHWVGFLRPTDSSMGDDIVMIT